MSLLIESLDYVHKMPPEAALHHGILIGMLFGEGIRRTYQGVIDYKASEKAEQDGGGSA